MIFIVELKIYWTWTDSIQRKARTNRSVNNPGAEAARDQASLSAAEILTLVALEYALNAVNQGVTALGIKGK